MERIAYIIILLSCISIQTTFAHTPLRACTTGDYPPLTSYNESSRTYQGFAITVAKQFGQHLNRPVIFVHSSWSDLNHSLITKCDIAIGGITKTVARAKDFYLSENLLTNRKLPVFSKENNSRFNHFKDIDRSEITVLENKGGTNEIFAKAHIKHAEIKILPQNAEVYACLNKYPNRSYVMFTDSIEIAYRSNQENSLLSNKGLQFIDINNNPISYKVAMTNKTDSGKKLIVQFNDFYHANKTQFKSWYQQALHLDYPQEAVSCPF